MIRAALILIATLGLMAFVDAFPAITATTIGVAVAYGFYRAFRWAWGL